MLVVIHYETKHTQEKNTRTSLYEYLEKDKTWHGQNIQTLQTSPPWLGIRLGLGGSELVCLGGDGAAAELASVDTAHFR